MDKAVHFATGLQFIHWVALSALNTTRPGTRNINIFHVVLVEHGLNVATYSKILNHNIQDYKTNSE